MIKLRDPRALKLHYTVLFGGLRAGLRLVRRIRSDNEEYGAVMKFNPVLERLTPYRAGPPLAAVQRSTTWHRSPDFQPMKARKGHFLRSSKR